MNWYGVSYTASISMLKKKWSGTLPAPLYLSRQFETEETHLLLEVLNENSLGVG